MKKKSFEQLCYGGCPTDLPRLAKNVRLNEIHRRRRNGCRVTLAPKAITQALTDIGSHSLRRASEVSNVMVDYSISAGCFRWQRGVYEQAMESRCGVTGTMPSASRVHGFDGVITVLSDMPSSLFLQVSLAVFII